MSYEFRHFKLFKLASRGEIGAKVGDVARTFLLL
jgi:hypothetical protein